MDLNDLIPKSDTIEVELVYKGKPLLNEDKTPMTIEVYLPHSKVSKQVMYDQQNEYLKRQKEGNDFKIEELVERGLDRLVGITKGWNITFGEDEEGNKVKPKFTKKKAKEIYEALEFIPECIQRGIETNEDFT